MKMKFHFHKFHQALTQNPLAFSAAQYRQIMVSLDSDPQPQTPPKHRQQTHLFNKGAEVEVSTDEEGFRGAWYTATILEAPPKSASKKRKKALIQYKTLVTEDGSAPLAEYVDLACLRPSPPEDSGCGDRVFEVNDVVEAGYRDGWWTGAVKKVLEGSRYMIFFDNPPDVIDFDGRDLRFHLEWVNGNWVRPKKLETAESLFSSGTMVEVNLEKDKVSDTWFPAVVIKENEDSTFLVKYQSSGNSDEAGAAKVIVDSLHIRPTPPHYADRNYELLEKVDTKYDIGWRAGVITKLLAGRRYNVFFKQGNEDKELSHSEIRPYAEWVDGKWICKSNEVMIASDNHEQVGNFQYSTNNPEVVAQLERSDAVEGSREEKPSCSLRNLMELSTDCDKKSPSNCLSPSKRKKGKLATSNSNRLGTPTSKKLEEGDSAKNSLSINALQLKEISIETPLKETLCGLATLKTGGKRTRITIKPMVGGQPFAKPESPFTGKTVKTKKWDVADLHCQKVDIVTKKGRPTKSPFRSSLVSTAVEDSNVLHATVQGINGSEGKTMEAEVPSILGLEAKGMSSSVADEGMLELTRHQMKNLNDLAGDRDMEYNQDKGEGSSQKRKRGRPRKLSRPRKLAVIMPPATEADCMTKDVDMAINGVSKYVADDDQPLSTWFGGINSSTGLSSGISANGRKEARERRVAALESFAIDGKGNRTLDGNQCLPFVKRSPIWNTIEAMEVFQIMPQKPHFCPLAECKEEYREGSAIGIMVTFASLFEKVTLMQFDDSKSVLESTLESVIDLEKHGFDVTMLQGRVNELLSIKDMQWKLLNESKDAGRQMEELTGEKGKLEERIIDIEKKIIELQEELVFAKSKMEGKDLEIARLSAHVDAMIEGLDNARHEFEKVANARWR